ncbi:MAG: acyl-CoA/acyl-ACP dehydrogenase [Rhodospirillaceae bacterium]|jgi:isovaleryl-CoA dehydrogenase|nr:acyl-CoA/acyl-ACP dehydrogenase [Rhodospirillaceae bacterium]MBT5240037.1 acyl-CoA/acyl-ACP dehydrogenase [Rhodospirillaceae bacterium]MBT5566402.1 acyl-CoA/acyl-ACP dehydrogenase [Rhodospirillaceae bacterium]MBT6961482.1 acyl-CoA/acyl-ACP dehydrogenase [Rhodospirillaceae bacterium]
MPLFDPTLEQRRFVAIAEDLAENQLRPRADEVDATAVFPKENFDAFAKAGLLGLRIPENLGGMGADVLSAVMVIERLARACGSTGMCFKMHCESTEPMWRLATAEQNERFVKPIAAGERITTTAIAETGTGSHTWSLQSSVTRNEESYELSNVRKGWVTSSEHADLYFTPAMLDDAGPGQFTSFVLEKNAVDWSIDGPWNGLGMRANASSPMTFSGTLPQGNRLGGESAWQTEVLPVFMPFSMITFAAVYLGIAEGAYATCVDHVTGRAYGDTGSKLAEIDGIQRYIGEMRIALDRTRALVYAVADLIERNDIADPAPFIESVCAADETALFVTRTAMNVGGGRSYGGQNALGRYLRDAQAGSVMAPTDDIIKLRVGRMQLGQPQF